MVNVTDSKSVYRGFDPRRTHTNSALGDRTIAMQDQNIKGMINNLPGEMLGNALARFMARSASLGGYANLSEDLRDTLVIDYCSDIQNLVYQNYAIRVSIEQIKPIILTSIDQIIASMRNP